ncbi:MAG: molybdopterin molybdotransferase MoeA [Spirochaetia bacterium]|nr:molybdopterin molybdotransferase MoeA [Spirochaetia bacterium]
MIQIDEAMDIIRSQKVDWTSENIPIIDALGRIMIKNLISPLDSPPFDKAAMDGFAINSNDSSKKFKILEVISAGDTPLKTVKEGSCSKIMTGAMMPVGADKIIRVEFANEIDGYAVQHTPEPVMNVIKKAENLSAGDKVLDPGRLKAKDIGIIASMGFPEVEVSKRPVIGVLTTGSELKNPGEKLGSGQIYNSNGFQMSAHIASTGCFSKYYGIIVDDRAALFEAVAKAFSECDIVLLSGGVSKGDYDYVPEVLEGNGMSTLFHRVAIKPGRPLLFGRKDDIFIFGLPGNPVSTFVTFEVFVKTLIYHLAGLDYKPETYKGKLSRGIKRRDTERTEFYPVILREGNVEPVKYMGSSHLNAMSEANGMIIIPNGIAEFKEGETVSVRSI